MKTKTKTKTTIHECDDCNWKGPESKIKTKLEDLDGLYERLDPGGIVPSGECPECGSFCYPATGRFVAADDLLAACESAAKIFRMADKYFPKSIRNGDKFDLLNIGVAIDKAIRKAKE